jgi:hypothetical protein
MQETKPKHKDKGNFIDGSRDPLGSPLAQRTHLTRNSEAQEMFAVYRKRARHAAGIGCRQYGHLRPGAVAPRSRNARRVRNCGPEIVPPPAVRPRAATHTSGLVAPLLIS